MALSWHQPRPATAPPRDPPKGWRLRAVGPVDAKRIKVEVVAMLALIALPGFLVGLDGIGDPSSISTDIGLLELLASLVGSFGAAGMAAQLLWRDGLLAAAGFNRRGPAFVIGYGLLGLACVYGALIGASIVVGGLYLAFGGDLESASSGDADIELSVASLAVAYAISITAGITEEVVFRAYAITRLQELGWKRAAVVVPGLVFTLLHLYQGVFALAGIGAITAVFTWLYTWKRSLLPVMLAHALFDAVQLTIAALVA